VRAADHAEERFLALFTVDRPAGVEDLVTAVLGVHAASCEGAEVPRLYPRPGSGNEFGRVFERKDEMTHSVRRIMPKSVSSRSSPSTVQRALKIL